MQQSCLLEGVHCLPQLLSLLMLEPSYPFTSCSLFFSFLIPQGVEEASALGEPAWLEFVFADLVFYVRFPGLAEVVMGARTGWLHRARDRWHPSVLSYLLA